MALRRGNVWEYLPDLCFHSLIIGIQLMLGRMMLQNDDDDTRHLLGINRDLQEAGEEAEEEFEVELGLGYDEDADGSGNNFVVALAISIISILSCLAIV